MIDKLFLSFLGKTGHLPLSGLRNSEKRLRSLPVVAYLPGCDDVVTVVMNTSWHFHANAAIFVRPVPAGNTLGVSSETGGGIW